jgi:HPt (histidine-containing phosphotransfer) domain-containing protein
VRERAVTGDAEAPVNVPAVLRWLGGDRALLQDLVRVFVEDAPGRGAALRAAAAARDAAQLERLAHSLKGSAAILGAARLQAARAALERAAQAGGAGPEPALLDGVDQALARVAEFFADPGWTAALEREAPP